MPCYLYLTGGGGYFIGVKKIIVANGEEIKVVLQNRTICVKGENLQISKLIDGDLEFVGKIAIVEWL